MQDPKNSHSRKPWYQKAVEMATLWKAFAKPTEIPSPNATIWRAISNTTRNIASATNPDKHNKLKKCTSQRVATSFTRVCLCAPISSYAEAFQADIVAPRRSFSYPPRSSTTSKLPLPTPPLQERTPSARISFQGRKIFRGKSLTDDVLMRRFVVEEEAMMQVRRRNQMEIIRKRSAMRRSKLIGPSPLSRMVIAEEE